MLIGLFLVHFSFKFFSLFRVSRGLLVQRIEKLDCHVTEVDDS